MFEQVTKVSQVKQTTTGGGVMKTEDNPFGVDLDSGVLQDQDHANTLEELVENKFAQVEQKVQGMVNNFQIEIIRQFEIQQTQLNNLVMSYMLDDSDAMDGPTEEPGTEDTIFVDKYTRVNQDDPKFATGYYF